MDARDVTRALNVFPEQISAANASVAFGFGGHLYSAQTGVEFQYLGFYAAVYAPNPDPAATDFWVWDRAVNTVRHYVQQ